MSNLLEQLEGIKQRFDEVSKLMIKPDIVSDQKKLIRINKEYKELEKIMLHYRKYKKYLGFASEAKKIIHLETDGELIEMAQDELKNAESELTDIEKELKSLLIPKDSEDHKNVILELRAGTGGDEACIFVEDIFRMYSLYLKEKKWPFQIINSTTGSSKGYKEIVMEIKGEEIYGTLKFESGVHRVQRVPKTESQGRVHTSAISVAVLPEAEDIDIDLNMEDVRRDTFRASGAGGQHVNKTESAIRLTHVPTGIVAECQEGRSQHKNYEKALRVLRSRLYQVELGKKQKERAERRKSLVSTGDRSAKIRTYNYPQGRITDHRINKSIFDLQGFLNGNIQYLIDCLKLAENTQKLAAKTEGL